MTVKGETWRKNAHDKASELQRRGEFAEADQLFRDIIADAKREAARCR